MKKLILYMDGLNPSKNYLRIGDKIFDITKHLEFDYGDLYLDYQPNAMEILIRDVEEGFDIDMCIRNFAKDYPLQINFSSDTSVITRMFLENIGCLGFFMDSLREGKKLLLKDCNLPIDHYWNYCPSCFFPKNAKISLVWCAGELYTDYLPHIDNFSYLSKMKLVQMESSAYFSKFD